GVRRGRRPLTSRGTRGRTPSGDERSSVGSVACELRPEGRQSFRSRCVASADRWGRHSLRPSAGRSQVSGPFARHQQPCRCTLGGRGPRYEKFFGGDPVKVKPGYVKFLPEWAPVNLALSTGGPVGAGTIDHVGVQVDSVATVMAQLARVKAAGLA